nr:restriction endonuclease [uncultured Sphaerochaeta sp.]
MEFSFSQLSAAPLIIDAVYKGGEAKNYGSEPLHELFPKLAINGGIRKVNRTDGSKKPAYVVLYTSMQELEWPDYLDEETGVFRYYGDNRESGKDILDTILKGNALLEDTFLKLHSSQDLTDIPPFFIFKKGGKGRDAQFLGLAAPGNPRISPDKDLVAFWRTMNGNRFQNYEAYFTILDTKNDLISREWLTALIYDHANNLRCAPKVWKDFINNGREGITPLKAKRILKIPNKYEQLQSDNEGIACLQAIRNVYADNPFGFERCAVDIVSKMDTHFVHFDLTRPWRDGGRDALGYYSIQTGGKANHPLRIDCALEAKCYSPDTSVGVRQMSRLISRIRYRQFGIMVTTSFVDSQAYKEVVEDGHPILIVTASDIGTILRNNAINTSNVHAWLANLVT